MLHGSIFLGGFSFLGFGWLRLMFPVLTSQKESDTSPAARCIFSVIKDPERRSHE